MTVEKILREFRNENYLDFRTHKYLSNNYNLTPCFNYDFAKNIVLKINELLEERFGGKYVIYNLEMDVESLRLQTLKDYLYNRIQDYIYYTQSKN